MRLPATLWEALEGVQDDCFLFPIIRTPLLRIEISGAVNALIAAQFAPVAPHGALRSFGEHGLRSGRFDPRARHGAPVYRAWRL